MRAHWPPTIAHLQSEQPILSAALSYPPFEGFGEFSLNSESFIYVLSRDYDEFLGLAEDLNLRIMDIATPLPAVAPAAFAARPT